MSLNPASHADMRSKDNLLHQRFTTSKMYYIKDLIQQDTKDTLLHQDKYQKKKSQRSAPWRTDCVKPR
jgi:hypothetical protein